MIEEFRIWLLRKIWYGRNPDRTMAKRFKLFIIVMILLIGISKLLYLAGITIPNVELITPVLVVAGAFSLYTGGRESWEKITRYFGLLAPLTVFVIDILFWGVEEIYLFTWPAFLAVWFIASQRNFSFLDDFIGLTTKITMLAVVGIFFYDIVTAFGVWILWYPQTSETLYTVYVAQIPFTLYHLISVIFVPPLVGLGKILSRVKVRVPVKVKASIKEREAK